MKRAFTLIEILISLSLVTLLTTIGVLIAVGNIQKSAINEADSDLKNTLTQARDYALAGRKIACSTPLRGWQVDINIVNRQVVLSEVCGSTLAFITKTLSSSLSISISGSSSILFSTVTGGTNLGNTSTITLSNVSGSAITTVTRGGVIQ